MNVQELAEIFEKFDDEYLEFEMIKEPLNGRLDLCAFLLLDKLVPGTGKIVSAAEHDEIYLDTDVEELAQAATEEDILTLVRCGVRYSSEFDCLCMFT